MYFKLLKKNYSEDEAFQILNPTNGIMLEAYSSNKEGLIILTPTNNELSKKEFVEFIDAYIENLQNIKIEVIEEYDKVNHLKAKRAKVYNKS